MKLCEFVNFCETLKTRVKLNLNFTWPYAITYTKWSMETIKIIKPFITCTNWKIDKCTAKAIYPEKYTGKRINIISCVLHICMCG